MNRPPAGRATCPRHCSAPSTRRCGRPRRPTASSIRPSVTPCASSATTATSPPSRRIGPRVCRVGAVRVPGWRAVASTSPPARSSCPEASQLDLGATAKAWCADRAAAAAPRGRPVPASSSAWAATSPSPGRRRTAAGSCGSPTATTPPPTRPGPLVAITSGGLATSGTAARRWWRGDASSTTSSTRRPAARPTPWWRTVSVAGASCVDANVAVHGRHRARPRSRPTGWRSAACRRASSATTARSRPCGGWPDDEPPASAP